MDKHLPDRLSASCCARSIVTFFRGTNRMLNFAATCDNLNQAVNDLALLQAVDFRSVFST